MKELFKNKKFVLVFGMIFSILLISLIGYITISLKNNNNSVPSKPESTATAIVTTVPSKEQGAEKTKKTSNKKNPSKNNVATNKKPSKPIKQVETGYDKIELEEIKETWAKKLKKCYIGMNSEDLMKVFDNELKPLENSAESGLVYDIGNGKEVVFIFTNLLFDCMIREDGKFVKQIRLS